MLLPGEQVTVITPGVSVDPFSGEEFPDWTDTVETAVDNVVVGWVAPVPLLDVSGATTSRQTLYFLTLPLVPLEGTRIRVRGTVYAVVGQLGDWRLGPLRRLEVPVVDLLAARRQAAESTMLDTCRIEHPSGTVTTDAGAVTATYVTLYTGRCRVHLLGASSQSRREVGDQQIAVLGIEVLLPVVGTEGIHVRDRVTILRATDDADLVDRVFRVSQPAPSSRADARRLQCIEVTA